MQSTSVTTAPRPQVMSSSHSYSRAMDVYAADMAEFEASPCRQAAADIGVCAGLTASLGCFVALPAVSWVVASNLGWRITAGATAVCCAVSGLGCKIGNIPVRPPRPGDPNSDTNGGSGGRI